MIRYHKNVEQRTEDWWKLRCGKLTASEVKLVLTPTLKVADNEKTRLHIYALAAQRVSGYAGPSYESDDMMRGREDEEDALIKYNETYAAVERCGFVENDEWGFAIGYSPDGLIGDDGLVEVKSRAPKHQMQAITEAVALGKVPDDHVLQVQTGLLVTGRAWCDYVSYCGGLYMATIKILPDPEIQLAIINAAKAFEEKVDLKVGIFNAYLEAKGSRVIKTERHVIEEITV